MPVRQTQPCSLRQVADITTDGGMREHWERSAAATMVEAARSFGWHAACTRVYAGVYARRAVQCDSHSI